MHYIKKIIIIIIYFYFLNILRKNEFFQLYSNKYKKYNYSVGKKFFYNNEYKFISRKCLNNYSFRALYISNFENENIQLINKIYEKYILEIIIDYEFKTISSLYSFLKPGMHEIKVSLDFEKLNTSANMFSDIPNIILIDFNQIFDNNKLISMNGMFKNCINLEIINFSDTINLKNVVDLSYMFANCRALTSLELPNYKSKKINNISHMFTNCSSLKYLNINYINTKKVKDMSGLFSGCSSLFSIDLSCFETSNVLDMECMFKDCSSLKSINIESFKINGKININFMFKNCSELISVKLPYLGEKQMKKINNMLKDCSKLPSQIIKSYKYEDNKINDICIIGLWYGHNYGSMLTYYALHEVIKNLGYSILMIDNPLGSNNNNTDKTLPKNMVSSFYNISQKKSLNKLFELNNECKCFLIGSDQLWNVYLSRAYKQYYFLGFVDNKRKKFSYGTSFGGKYKGTEEEKNLTKFNLKRFDGISVRDELSLNITKKIFDIKDAIQVCDPTLLLDSTNYIKLLKNININNPNEYFLAYILDPNLEILNRLSKLSIDRNIKVIIILGYSLTRKKIDKKIFSFTREGNLEIKNIIDLKEWLYLYNNSKSIFTDSYHGTIFSIIFRKPFITLKNKKRGGERFVSLLKPLQLMNRLFETADCINKKYDLYDTINYSLPMKKLYKIKEKSYNWLKKKLKMFVK